MKVIIPASGLGKRFLNAGFEAPKPFIKAGDLMIIEHVLFAIPESFSKSVIFTEQLVKDNKPAIQKLEKSAEIVVIPEVTDGPLRTAFNGVQELGFVGGPVAFFNSDMVINCNYENFHRELLRHTGAILTFIEDKQDIKHWSFVKEKDGFLTEIVEKRRVSDIASLGVYGFNSIDQFMTSAERTFTGGKKQNNEWYFSCLYEDFLETANVVYMNVEKSNFKSLGTPFELYEFLQHLLIRG